MFLYHGTQQQNNEVINLLSRVYISFFETELPPYLRSYFFKSSVGGIAEIFGIEMKCEECNEDVNPLFTFITIEYSGSDMIEVISSAEIFLYCYGYLDTQKTELSEM